MSVFRSPENPLIQPKDVPPSRPDKDAQNAHQRHLALL